MKQNKEQAKTKRRVNLLNLNLSERGLSLHMLSEQSRVAPIGEP